MQLRHNIWDLAQGVGRVLHALPQAGNARGVCCKRWRHCAEHTRNGAIEQGLPAADRAIVSWRLKCLARPGHVAALAFVCCACDTLPHPAAMGREPAAVRESSPETRAEPVGCTGNEHECHSGATSSAAGTHVALYAQRWRFPRFSFREFEDEVVLSGGGRRASALTLPAASCHSSEAPRGAMEEAEDALRHAAGDGRDAAVREGIAKCVNVNAGNFFGDTPLHKAAFYARESSIRLLLAANADVHKTNDSEFTPLHCAAGSGHEGSIRLLLDANANVNETNESGRIPLHLAAYNGHEARLLLDANADLGIKDLDGETARDKAKSDAMRALVDDAPRKEPTLERPHAVAGGAL